MATQSALSTLIPSYLYRNMLLHPQYLTMWTNEHAKPSNHMEANVEGDPLLNPYINGLNKEIFSQPPENLNEFGRLQWTLNDLGKLFEQVAYYSRLPRGWAVLDFTHKSGARVLSLDEVAGDFLKDIDKETQRITIVGIKVAYTDYSGNTYTDDLRFDDAGVFLFKFAEGNKFNFASGDITNAMFDIVVNARQIKGQMDYASSKSGFKFFKYGEEADDVNTKELNDRLRYVDLTTGIGAKGSVLEDIVHVPHNTDVTKNIEAYDKNLQLFAGITRLPMSFYQGERTAGGLGENAEKVDLLKIDRKKESLFNNFEPFMRLVLSEQFGVSIDEELVLHNDVVMDEVEENDDEVEPKKKKTHFWNKKEKNQDE